MACSENCKGRGKGEVLSTNVYGIFWVPERLTESPCCCYWNAIEMSWMHVSPLFFLNKYNQVNIAESFLVPKDLAVSQGHHSEHRYSLPRTGEVERRSSWPNVCWPWSSPKKLSLLLNLWYHLLFFFFFKSLVSFLKSLGRNFGYLKILTHQTLTDQILLSTDT